MLATYKLFHGKKETSFPSKSTVLMVKTDTWLRSASSRNQKSVCIRFMRVLWLQLWRSTGQKVKLNYSAVATANLVNPPGSSEAQLSLQGYPQLEQMGQAFVLLHQTVIECKIPWGRRWGSTILLKAIHWEGHSCKLSTGKPCLNWKNKCLSPEGISK